MFDDVVVEPEEAEEEEVLRISKEEESILKKAKSDTERQWTVIRFIVFFFVFAFMVTFFTDLLSGVKFYIIYFFDQRKFSKSDFIKEFCKRGKKLFIDNF